METTKKCNKCGEVKSLSAFYKDKKCKYGVSSCCKDCKNEYDKFFREKNKIKISTRKKELYKINADKIKAINRDYRESNKDKIKSYRESCKDATKLYKKTYNEANKDKTKAYCLANKDKINAYSKDCRLSLKNSYIAGKIGLPVSECPPELLELKRIQLKIKRAIRQYHND